jgi:ATP-dependent Clp protease ATP-binding subunit ClpA
MANKIERFTNDARKAIAISEKLARECGHHIIEPYHLLLAMTHDKSLICANLLEKYDIIEEKLLPPFRSWFPPIENSSEKEINLSAGFKKCLDYTVDEARRMGHHRINSGHLLAGVLRIKSPEMLRLYGHFLLDVQAIREDARSIAHEALTGYADVKFTWTDKEEISFFDAVRQSIRMTLGLGKKKNDE